MGGVLLIVFLIALAAIALFRLRRAKLEEIPRFLWVLLVIILPVFGPLALFIVQPGLVRSAEKA